MHVHAASIAMICMIDGAKPQPPQTFKPADVLGWVRAELVMQPLSGLEVVRAG
jgi:ribonuclease PH